MMRKHTTEVGEGYGIEDRSLARFVSLRDGKATQQAWLFSHIGDTDGGAFENCGYTGGESVAFLLEGGDMTGHYDWYKLKRMKDQFGNNGAIDDLVRAVLQHEVGVDELIDGAVYGPADIEELVNGRQEK